MAVENKYEVLIKAKLVTADIQKQLDDQMKLKPVKIKTSLGLDEKTIANQVKRWNNALSKMKSSHPDAFNTSAVQTQVSAFRGLISQYEAGTASMDDLRTGLDNVRTTMAKTSGEMRMVTRDGLSFGKMISLAAKKVAIWALATGTIYGLLRQIKDGIQYIKDLDKEMTNIQFVTGMTNYEVGELAVKYNELAGALGSTTLEIAKGSTEWFRQGKTVKETAELMEQTMMMAKLGNMESAQSTEYLTSIINGFKLEAEDTALVVDKLVALDNAYATSVAEISAALQKSSNSAQQAGVDFDELASYITVISSVTRQGGESIGTSLRTMFARMQNIKLGKLFEDDATTLNDVEKALSLVDIELRDSETTFKDMDSVLDEVASKWYMLNEVEQSAIANAVAGVRQRENFLVLMNNYDQVLKAQTISADAAGLAQQRFGVYLDSVEASVNKFTVAWEKMAVGVTNSNTIKGIIDFGTALLGILDYLGPLNVALTAFGVFAATKLGIIIPGLSRSIAVLAVNMGLANSAAGALAIGLGAFGVVAAVLIAINIFNKLNITMSETYDKFKKLKNESESNQQELKDLAEEYETLANKTEKTADETIRLLDIQTILNTKYGAAKDGVNAYSDAVNGETEAIKENIKWMQAKAQQEADNFVRQNQEAYEKAKKAKEGVGYTGLGTTGGVVSGTLEERISKVQDMVASGKTVGKFVLSGLYEELAAVDALIIDYEHYGNVLSIINDTTLDVNTEPAQQSLDSLVSTVTSTKTALSDAIKTSLDLIDSYDEYGQLTAEQVDQLKEAFPDDYLNLIYTEGEYIKLNTDALRNLVAARAEEAFSAAQSALANANAANDIRNSAIATYESAMMIANASGLMADARRALDMRSNIPSEIDTSALQAEFDIAKARADSFRSGSFWTNQATQALHGYGSALGGSGGVNKAQENYNSLLKDTISMLKQQANDQKDALKDQLDGYKKIIDAKKKILDQMQEEDRYQDDLAEKNEDLSDIENELLQIQFDNSDEAKRRRLELEDEKAKKITEIDQFQADRSVEIQKDALDEEYDRYEKQLSKKIDALDDYLKKEGAIRAQAISLLESRNQTFYNNLMAWNKLYGTGISRDITDKWNNATQAANNYANVAAAAMGISGISPATYSPESFQIGVPYQAVADKQSNYKVFYDGSSLRYQNPNTGQYVSETYYDLLPKYHSGGIVGGGSSGKDNEIFAKLLKEEIVVTENQAYNFIRNTLPGLLSIANAAGETNVPVSITIEGNVDKNVMPELKENITKAVYKAISKRGMTRNVSDFSL